MARATVGEVYDIIHASYARGRDGEDRVHRSARNVVARPRPGHLYLVPGAPTDAQMAQTSDRAGPAEAALLKINDAHFVKIGVRGFATANIFIPPRDPETQEQAIVEFLWINHTHPLDMGNPDERTIQGPTDADIIALEQISRVWDQRSSYIIVCRNGQVLRRVPFALAPEPAASARRRRIWTPGD